MNNRLSINLTPKIEVQSVEPVKEEVKITLAKPWK